LNPSTASRTALATSLMRALHSRSDPVPLLSDTWGDRLVPESAKAALRQLAMERIAKAKPGVILDGVEGLELGLRSNAAYADVILRSRYMEDALKEAVARGIRQYVIIGAGFDSFICRRPAWAAGVTIIEVDHPSTQRLKRERLAACGVALPRSVEFVEADLSMESLGSALARSSFRVDHLTFFSWLGVTMYLTREANLNALRSIATCAPAGSQLVFTYVDEAVLSPDQASDESFRRLMTDVSAAGEAFRSGFDVQTMSKKLLETRLLLLEDVDGDQAASRYDPEGQNAFRTAAAAHIVHARGTGPDRPQK
jgi:methyltransferase (TIGR00027 family)